MPRRSKRYREAAKKIDRSRTYAILEALEITREIVQSFLEVSVWPFSRSSRSVDRFLGEARDRSTTRIVPFDPGHLDLAAAIDGLRDSPEEGFLVGLLAPEPASLPAELLKLDSVRL